MRTILNFIALGSLLAGAWAASGCGEAADAGSAEGPTIVATTTQLADLARNVAGDRASVTGLLEANSDPHEYEPRPSDAEAVATADLILRSGGDVDVWVDQLVSSSGSEAPVLDILEALPTPDGAADAGDPHWWEDPRAAAIAVRHMAAELVRIDPEGAAQYRASARSYTDELRHLDREIARCMEAVPRRDRLLVTSHDALGRYAARYGITVVGSAIPALSTQAQPSAGETAALVELIQRTGARAVFPEAGVARELEEAIASEAGAVVGDELWADTLGPPGSGAETYVDAMAKNTAALVAGFTGGERRCTIDVHG